MRTTPVPLGHVAVVHLYRRRPGRIWPGPSSGDPMRAPLVWPHPSPSPSLPTSTQHPRRSHEYLYLHPAPKTLYPLPFILPRRPTTLRPPLAATVSTGPLHILNPPRGLHPSARHSGPTQARGQGSPTLTPTSTSKCTTYYYYYLRTCSRASPRLGHSLGHVCSLAVDHSPPGGRKPPDRATDLGQCSWRAPTPL